METELKPTSRTKEGGRPASGWWCAVLAHDARYDGSFVYAVRTTGVYCRPSCPARRPALDKVVFFALPEAAERAGFRPCRRCRPRSAPSTDPRAEAVSAVCRLLESNADERLTLAQLAGEAAISPHHLLRLFRRTLGVTPHEYAQAVRSRLLKSRLKKAANVAAAVFEAGYGSSSRVYEKADANLGMTPRSYRRGGQGMNIRYTIAGCALGRVLVGVTERGICAVQLGDNDVRLEAALRAEYPRAQLRRSPSELKRWVEPVLRLASGSAAPADRVMARQLPLDISATAFQLRVWRALARIPAGRTQSYGEVARSIGRAGAARAVARACASNPVALVVPCHRVVRADGAAGGYRWGSERKARLLAMERGNRGVSNRRRRRGFAEVRRGKSKRSQRKAEAAERRIVLEKQETGRTAAKTER